MAMHVNAHVPTPIDTIFAGFVELDDDTDFEQTDEPETTSEIQRCLFSPTQFIMNCFLALFVRVWSVAPRRPLRKPRIVHLSGTKRPRKAADQDGLDFSKRLEASLGRKDLAPVFAALDYLFAVGGALHLCIGLPRFLHSLLESYQFTTDISRVLSRWQSQCIAVLTIALAVRMVINHRRSSMLRESQEKASDKRWFKELKRVMRRCRREQAFREAVARLRMERVHGGWH
ncbi:hypothetical protein B0H21DRAFT_444426 [Amylocystis lapponica]|nr:hypothetical protein B0H21DRAFT_444426 [Amylocystis lapponica]